MKICTGAAFYKNEIVYFSLIYIEELWSKKEVLLIFR